MINWVALICYFNGIDELSNYIRANLVDSKESYGVPTVVWRQGVAHVLLI